jgi:pimeloyl-[acyl-carrier protein] methyl ester esterase
MELVFIHGWGFDARFWDALGALLPKYEKRRVDFGYFGTPAPIPTSPDSILIGHSLGFLHGIRQKQGWRGWVAINSFRRFLRTDTQAGCASDAELRELKIGLSADPARALDTFYDRIEAPVPEGMPDLERLRAGLEELRYGDISGTLEQMDARGLVLASRNDPLVSPKVSEALCASVRHGELRWHETGGHALPLRDPDWCALMIDDFLKRAAA